MTIPYPNIASTTALALPDISEQKIWENKFEALPGISRIAENDFGRLRQVLASCEDQDSYLTSPMYYAFTGRHGLWVYEKNDAFVLSCLHPNIPSQVLIFPQHIKGKTDLVADLLSVIPEPIGGVRLARAKLGDVAEHDEFLGDDRHIALQRCEEAVLDWKYPVHILSTDNIAELAGHKYMIVRNRVRQLKNHSVEVIPFDPLNQWQALENLLHRWAKHNATNPAEYDLLYAPYETLFSQSLDKSLGMSGLMIFVDGEMQAVSLWDISNSRQKTANAYVNFCNTAIKGLSEFLMVKCCEALRDQGINFVNLGGSETESLDTFKRKFSPVNSIDLCSVNVTINDKRTLKPRRTTDPSKRHQVILGTASNV